MPAHVDPLFLVAWVRDELIAAGEPSLLDSLAARAESDGLDREEAELDAAGQLAERRGLLDGLERAAGELWLAEVREARGIAEKLERSSGPACVAWLQATSGAALRLQMLSTALSAEPSKSVAELDGLGSSPGCSVR
ncbi:MAG TPA: hypothetical protein VH083_24965 [Myxococcales bacterium]|jgi:hypothetical protein|nr:hypothetical protein [Myxococcales bacterium]